MDTLGNNSKGMDWDTKEEVAQLGELSYTVTEPTVAQGRPHY